MKVSVTAAAVQMSCSDRPDEKFGRRADLSGWAATVDCR